MDNRLDTRCQPLTDSSMHNIDYIIRTHSIVIDSKNSNMNMYSYKIKTDTNSSYDTSKSDTKLIHVKEDIKYKNLLRDILSVLQYLTRRHLSKLSKTSKQQQLVFMDILQSLAGLSVKVQKKAVVVPSGLKRKLEREFEVAVTLIEVYCCAPVKNAKQGDTMKQHENKFAKEQSQQDHYRHDFIGYIIDEQSQWNISAMTSETFDYDGAKKKTDESDFLALNLDYGARVC